MIRWNRSQYLILAFAVLLTSTTSKAQSCLGNYGTGMIELTNYSLATGRFEFLVRVVPDIDVASGELVAFHAVGDRGSPEGRAVLWAGAAKRGDTVSATYTVVFASAGRYRVAGQIRLPEDPRYGVKSICGSTLYLDIGEDTVLSSPTSFYHIVSQRMRNEVVRYKSELQKRGIHSLSLDSVQILAPDIFHQLQRSSGYFDLNSMPPGWSAKDHRAVPHSGPTRYIHGKDSSSYPVTKPGYHGDSAEGARKGGIPERVLNRRPRHRVPIPSKQRQDGVGRREKSRTVIIPTPTPISDSLRMYDTLAPLRFTPRDASADSSDSIKATPPE